jgi:putative transposase
MVQIMHLVFVTKYRRGVFTKEILDDLRKVLSSVCADFEAELVQFDGEDDHVHLLVNYPPKVSASMLVSYFAGSCGGAPLAVIRQYIEKQQSPH